jgi:hypothetical protein
MIFMKLQCQLLKLFLPGKKISGFCRFVLPPIPAGAEGLVCLLMLIAYMMPYGKM